MNSMRLTKLRNNQQGMVAIVTTLVIMMVITLIVSSFALIVRREQTQSLDRQLSTQAFYAAEAGISDAMKALDEGRVPNSINQCTGATAFGTGTTSIFNKVIDGNVSYSCVLIQKELQALEFTSVSPEDGTFLVPINTTGISRLKISWQNQDGTDTFVTDTNMVSRRALPQAATLPSPLIKATLFPGFGSGVSLDTDDFIEGAQTVYMYPNGSASANSTTDAQIARATAADAAGNGAFAYGNCNTGSSPRYCNSEITNLTAGNYFLALRSYYAKAHITITAFNSSGQQIELKDAQAMIDVTGKSQDVLRRVQVFVPVDGSSGYQNVTRGLPEGAIEATDGICKKILITDNRYKNSCDTGGGTWTPFTTTPTGGPGAGTGTADIDNTCLPSEPPDCNKDPGNTPDYIFSQSFVNNSDNVDSTILNCTWIWGDGKQDNYPASSRFCKYQNRASHLYDDTTTTINATNGRQGCRKYTVTLIMRFTPTSGYADKTDTLTALLPRGSANDIPDGICTKAGYKAYTP